VVKKGKTLCKREPLRGFGKREGDEQGNRKAGSRFVGRDYAGTKKRSKRGTCERVTYVVKNFHLRYACEKEVRVKTWGRLEVGGVEDATRVHAPEKNHKKDRVKSPCGGDVGANTVEHPGGKNSWGGESQKRVGARKPAQKKEKKNWLNVPIS